MYCYVCGVDGEISLERKDCVIAWPVDVEKTSRWKLSRETVNLSFTFHHTGGGLV